MATLKGEVKAFIVQSLACFDTPSQVVELVKKEFGLNITRQQVESHDPTKANGRGLAQKWVELFHETRKRFHPKSPALRTFQHHHERTNGAISYEFETSTKRGFFT